MSFQHFDSLQLLNDFVINPDGWVQHVQRYTASISTTLLYGWRTPQTSTGYVKDLLEVSILVRPFSRSRLTILKVDGRYIRGNQLPAC